MLNELEITIDVNVDILRNSNPQGEKYDSRIEMLQRQQEQKKPYLMKNL